NLFGSAGCLPVTPARRSQRSSQEIRLLALNVRWPGFCRTLPRLRKPKTRSQEHAMTKANSFGLVLAILAAAGWGGSSGVLGGNVSDGGISDNGGNNGSGLDGGYPDGGCQPMSLQSGTSVDGYVSDVYNWFDSDCRPRSAALVRNNAVDPGGSH